MPAGRPNRRESTAEAIRRAIILGELQPGQKLREISLAAELGVSRPTLREALLSLAQEGLIVSEHHRGFSVARLDPDGIRDLAEARLALDRMALASIRSRPERLADVKAAWSTYAERAEDADPFEQHAAHVEFHRALWEASQQSTLLRLWPVIESLSMLVLAQDQVTRQDPRRALEMHGQLVTALIDGDDASVDEALQQHTRRSAEEFLSLRDGDGRDGHQ